MQYGCGDAGLDEGAVVVVRLFTLKAPGDQSELISLVQLRRALGQRFSLRCGEACAMCEPAGIDFGLGPAPDAVDVDYPAYRQACVSHSLRHDGARPRRVLLVAEHEPDRALRLVAAQSPRHLQHRGCTRGVVVGAG